jgi:hypothetical protein
VGDFEIGARYTWTTVGSRLTHIALAFDASFPTGDPRKGLGEAAYTVAPSLLVSRELREGKYQIFSTTGADFVLAHRQLVPPLDEQPRHTFFSNSGLSRRTGRGWAVAEISVSTNRWSGGNNTQGTLAPSYVWRVARRVELLIGVPVGLTSSTDPIRRSAEVHFRIGRGS